jgi:hypothetical protein
MIGRYLRWLWANGFRWSAEEQSQMVQWVQTNGVIVRQAVSERIDHEQRQRRSA